MKKSVFVSAFLLIVVNAIAQDIITTTDAQYIRAKITEVSKDAVKYLEFDNQDGPTFVLATEDIATIRYQNGKVVAYKVVQEEETATAETEDETGYLEVIRQGNTYYYDGMPMKKDVYESFLQERCLSAYNQYKSGRGLATGGWTMMGGAAGLVVLVGIVQGMLPNNNGVKACWVLPGLMLVTSIPLVSAGYVRMHRSADTFNTMCADKQSQAYWSINASQNGIGLALNF